MQVQKPLKTYYHLKYLGAHFDLILAQCTLIKKKPVAVILVARESSININKLTMTKTLKRLLDEPWMNRLVHS